jgi:hypothetical protein
MTPIFKDWGLFSLANIAVALESLLGLSAIAGSLSAIHFSEWTVLSVMMVVAGAISQWGFKTGYMQMVITESSRYRQLQNLRSGLFFLLFTGLVAGLVVGGSLGTLYFMDSWESVDVLILIPLLMAFNNAQILLVTDLRVNSRVHLLTWLTFFRIPVFILIIYSLIYFEQKGLFIIFIAQTITSLMMLVGLLYILRFRFLNHVRWKFLKSSINLGTPIMLGLLLKYAADALVTLSIRWGMTIEWAGDYGRSVKMLEAFNSLFFLAFIMSWTPNFFVLSKQYFDQSALLIKTVQRALMLILLGCPLAYLTAIFMQQLVPTLAETSLWSSALFMVIARISSFAALSPAQFGFVISRRYKITTWVYFAELLVTAMAVGVTIYFDQFFWTFTLSGIIPWLVVGLNYYLSIREISRPRNLSQI